MKKKKVIALAEWWLTLPAWAKRIVTKFAVALALVGVAHLPVGPIQDAARGLALGLRDDEEKDARPSPVPAPTTGGRDGGAA